MSGLLAYVQDQQQYIGLLLLSHIQLTLLSVAIAVCIGVPLGIYISERERLLRPVMGFANLAQAIPSLALLGFLVPYMGIVISPTAVTLEIRMPAMITGRASGSRTLNSTCISVIPILLAASSVSALILRSPVQVFFKMGSSEYKTTIATAVTAPIPI